MKFPSTGGAGFLPSTVSNGLNNQHFQYKSGQFIINPEPECFGDLGRISLRLSVVPQCLGSTTKLPFGVTSAVWSI